MDFPWRISLRNGHHIFNKPAFRTTNPFSGQHSDGMRRIRGLRKVITRRMQNVMESLWVGDHEPIFLDQPQW
jgi:hypothetical protein